MSEATTPTHEWGGSNCGAKHGNRGQRRVQNRNTPPIFFHSENEPARKVIFLGVSKPKAGNKTGNEITISKAKPSIHAGFKASFERFHRPRIDGG